MSRIPKIYSHIELQYCKYFFVLDDQLYICIIPFSTGHTVIDDDKKDNIKKQQGVGGFMAVLSR